MLTREEREYLQALTEQLRRAHKCETVQAPVHISEVIAGMPVLATVRGGRG